MPESLRAFSQVFSHTSQSFEIECAGRVTHQCSLAMHDVLRALVSLDLLNLLLPILPVLQILTAVQQLSDDRGAGGRGEALG